ncbi:ATP-binding Cassette (ABC) Superfamily, partial [Thraustotheca clavata]
IYYNKTSAELKRMDSISRSPVVNMIQETINGLSTIRAFGMTSAFKQKNREVVDKNQGFFLLYRIVARWLQMRLDWLSSFIIAGAAFLVVASKGTIGVVAAGLTLTYASQISNFLSRITTTYSMTTS